MKFACYSDWNQLPESASALFEQGEKDSIFFSRWWFENVAAALDDGEVMMLACVLDENRALAILPLVKSGGNHYRSLQHRYTTHYSLLLGGDDPQGILTCLVEGLQQLPVDSLLLEPVADDDCSVVGLRGGMQAAGYRCESMFRLYNWIYRLQGQSYEQYMATRPARLRNTISRKQRKLDREHGYEIRLFTGDAVPQAMSDYYAVYTASWKANEQYVDFLDRMVAGFSRAGWSRLGVLYVNGRPAAAQLWYVVQGKASIFRLAYDEAWKQYSPGSILTSFLMEYVIETDKVEQIDFLTGNEAYKQDWMSERRERFALSCVKDAKAAERREPLVKSLKRILSGLGGGQRRLSP
jgi:hypothetical protein